MVSKGAMGTSPASTDAARLAPPQLSEASNTWDDDGIGELATNSSSTENSNDPPPFVLAALMDECSASETGRPSTTFIDDDTTQEDVKTH